MIRIFSKRYEQAIFKKRIGLSLSKKLRLRSWYILERFNFSFDFMPKDSSYMNTTDVLDEVNEELLHRHGVEKLYALNGNNKKVEVDLKGFVKGAYPAQVLDAIELFYYSYERLQGVDLIGFQGEINNAFEEEGSAWRLTDGQFFKIDSEFLAIHVISRSYELLKAEGYEGALDEFNEARNDLAASDYKSAILNACKSFESVLKTILERESGNASFLIRELVNNNFYSDMPDSFGRSFGEQVFNALPFLRNRLGGHGQGEEIINVPKPYAELAIHLAGSFIQFSVARTLSLAKCEDKQVEAVTVEDPF